MNKLIYNTLCVLSVNDNNWFEGFRIIKKYHKNALCEAEEGKIIYGKLSQCKLMTTEDAKKLKELGWTIEEIYDNEWYFIKIL